MASSFCPARFAGVSRVLIRATIRTHNIEFRGYCGVVENVLYFSSQMEFVLSARRDTDRLATQPQRRDGNS